MSINIKEKIINKEKNEASNLVNIIEKYYLPKDMASTQISKGNTLDTNLSDYLTLLSTAKENEKKLKNESLKSSIISSETKNINFFKIFRNYIVPYFTLKDLISLKRCNKMFNSLIDKKSIDLCVLANTTKKLKSVELRGEIWYHYLNIKEFNKELFLKENKKFTKDNNDNINNDDNNNGNKIISNSENEENEENQQNQEKIFYNKSVELIKYIKNNEKEKLPKIYNDEKIKSIENSIDFITRDIDRTFHSSYFTEENGREGMQRILEALCTISYNDGYCQGMNFIIGGLLYLLRSEYKSFYIFNCILNNNLYQYNRLFADNTPDYFCRVHQINYYVKKYIPEVYYSFKKKNIPFDIIYSGWILTLFGNYLNIDKLDFPWTCFFIDKWKGLIKICLIFIYELKEELVKRDLEGISILIKNEVAKKDKYHNNFNYSFRLYKDKFKVRNKQLRILKEEYYIILAKKKLDTTNQNIEKWADDQKEPLNEYLKEKEKIEQNSIKDIEKLKNLNEIANQKYLLSLERYNTLIKYIHDLKIKIDKLATDKYSYEDLFSYFKKAINQIINKSNVKGLYKDMLDDNTLLELNDEEKNKIKILQEEKNNIMENYIPIKDEYDMNTRILLKCYDILDKLKSEVENWESEKNKRRHELQDYLFIIEQKKDEIIKNLIEKLKLSVNFKKNNNF